MGKSSTNIRPSLGWFFFSEREPQSVKEELLQNLQAQWMALHILQSKGFKPQLQEWAALGLYLLQFSRIVERLPHRLAPEAAPLTALLDAGWPQWLNSMTAESLAGIAQQRPTQSDVNWSRYTKQLEELLCSLLDTGS